MNKTKLLKEVELIWEEMGAQCDEGYSISGHTLNKIVSRAYDNASEKSSDISPNSIAQFAERTVCPNCTSEDIYKRPDNMTRCNDCKCYWHTGL